MSTAVERIIYAREKAGYNRKDWAELLGFPYRTVTNYENGSREPGLSYLVLVSNKTGLSVNWLSGMVDDKQFDSFSLSDVDPQIQAIDETCERINAQGLEHIKLFAEITAGNPEYQK